MTNGHPGVWCCERRASCRWQGYALHQGLAWGRVPEGGEWLDWHRRECRGILVQLLAPQPAARKDPGIDLVPRAFTDAELIAQGIGVYRQDLCKPFPEPYWMLSRSGRALSEYGIFGTEAEAQARAKELGR